MLTVHDCLIEVGDDILSLDQQFETFCYTEHKHFDFENETDPENMFLILLSITHVTTLTILYTKKIQPHFFFISSVEVLCQNLMILKTILVAKHFSLMLLLSVKPG